MYTSFIIRALNVRREDLESSEFRSILLVCSVIIFIFAAGVIVIIPDLLASDKVDVMSFVVKGVIWLGCFLVLYLLRIRLYTTAKIAILTHINLMVFLLTIREGVLGGSSAFFIPIVMLSLLILNDKNRIKYFFFALSGILLFIGYLNIIPVPEQYKLPEEALQFHFFSRLLLSAIITFILGIYLQNLHAKSEYNLKSKNSELIKANEELDKFVYSTSHDLKGPLKSILGLINLSEHHSKQQPELENLLEMMRNRVSDLDNFISDIAIYSKNSRTEIENVNVNLRQFVKKQIEDLSYMEGAEKIYFEVNIPEDVEITTDASRFKTILNNIIYNAIKYRDSDKPASYIKIGIEEKNKHTSIYVEDNGIGIPKNIQNKIFKMFFRANEYSSGSGLGLYLVKECIEKLGGEISLKSTIKNGSTFYIYLPDLIVPKAKTIKNFPINKIALELVSNG